MASLMTYGIAGYTIARICVRRPVPFIFWVVAFLAPMLPELDLLPQVSSYGTCFGHQEAFHSLAMAFVVAAILAILLRIFTGTYWLKDCFLGLFLGISTHPLLDALSHGGTGVAIFWPSSCRHYIFPVRPLEPVAHNMSQLLQQGIFINSSELYYVWIPCFVVLILDYLFQRRH